MSVKIPKPPPVAATFLFDIRFLKKGKHSAIVNLPAAYYGAIGKVVAQWGQFEPIFDACLLCLIEARERTDSVLAPERWDETSFRRRRELFKSINNAWLAPKLAETAVTLSRLCDTAGDLRHKRDMISHGHFEISIAANSSDVVSCYAINTKSKHRMLFDAPILAKLHADISHLTADFLRTFATFAVVEGPVAIIPDDELIRRFRDNDREIDVTTVYTDATTQEPPTA